MRNLKKFEKDNVVLVLGDAREVLKTVPDAFFDAVITDPPYGIGFEDYDSEKDVFFELEEELFRVLKKDAWLVFWWATKRIPEVSKLRLFKYRWMLVAEMKGLSRKGPLGDRNYAPIFVFSFGNPRLKRKIPDIIPAIELPLIDPRNIRSEDFKATYCQALLLSAFAGENGQVLDPFAGYGSLLLASLLTKSAFVFGIEKNPNRFEIAKAYLEAEKVFAFEKKKQEAELF